MMRDKMVVEGVVTSEPGYDGVVVGQVVSVAPGMATMGALGAFEGVVLTEAQNWDFDMCCAACPCCSCCKDPGLCMYACCFPSCLGAEISAKIGNKGCCGTRGSCEQWCAAWSVALLAATLGLLVCGAGACFSACVWNKFLAQTRDAQKAIYQLPDDELCCADSCTTFLPFACCDCTTSALFQQAYYLKHRQRIDFDCCCYKCCCAFQKPPDHRLDGSHAATALLL